LLLQWLVEAQTASLEHACPFFFLHTPIASQVFEPVQVSVSSALVTATQVPPTPLHAWHVPQVWLQQ
jgi:hypothetical protein